VFLVPWAFYSVFVASLGKFQAEDFKGYTGLGTTVSVQRFQYADGNEGYAWYMLFVLLWTAQFIIAVGQITLALALSTWYFTRDKNTVGNSTLLSAIGTASTYHLGTAAFGSLIIAIVQFIRSIIAYIQKKVRGPDDKGPQTRQQCALWVWRADRSVHDGEQAKASKNKVAEYVLCCVQCCLWCLENCLKFVNKNAYIQVRLSAT
jgi:hypothetical protein